MFTENKEIQQIKGLKRIERCSAEEFQFDVMELTHTVYEHEEIFGQYCTIQTYIDCPPETVFRYMSNVHSLSEWTYSTREYKKVDEELYRGKDLLDKNTHIYCSVKSNREAMTVDYHCAWDQGEKLWMIYLNRIVDAETVFNKPGSVVFWHNCRHPFYDNNPYPEKAPAGRIWVGELWESFYAGHKIEAENLKKILEYRHKNKLSVDPFIPEKDAE
jgi:hypothetical protein